MIPNSCLKQLLLRSLLNSEFSMSIIPSTFNTWSSSERISFPYLSPIYIFIHLSNYICITHRFLSYSMAHYWFFCSNCPHFALWELLQFGVDVLIIFELFLTLWHYKMFQAHLVLSDPALEWDVSLRSPGSFHCERFVEIEMRCWLCSLLLGSCCFWSPQQTKRKNMSAAPPCSWGTCSETPSGCLKPWIVLNPIYTMFISYTYITMIKFNL